MSFFPAYFGARKGPDDDSAPTPEPENESRADVFNLIPPRATEKYERPEPIEKPETIEVAPQPEGRNVHAVNAMDLTRLSIDNDGRLYWDGKPVEVRRRLMMSPGQMIAAIVVAFFIVLGAIGSVLQATATVSQWACRIGLASSCNAPTAPTVAPKPMPRVDIPA